MEQRKKCNLSINLIAILFCLTITSCFLQSPSNNDKVIKSDVCTTMISKVDLNVQNKEEIRDNLDEKATICLSDLMDIDAGLDTTWIGQVDFNSDRNQIDTLWTMSLGKVYKSSKLDHVLAISNGLYVDYLYDYGYFESEENFEIVNKINIVTDQAYALILQENDSDCKKLLDVLTYKRPYFISCAFESPSIGGSYANYLAVGAYVNNVGTLYDKRYKREVFYEGSHVYQINKVYGINENGKLTMLNDKFGVPISPNLDKYYFNDTIVFSLPF